MVPPKLQRNCIVTQIVNADKRICLLIFQHSAPRWFSIILEQETFQPGVSFSWFSLLFTLPFHCIFCNKKTRPKSWGEYSRGSTQVNDINHYLEIINADKRICLLLVQHSTPRWFSVVLEQETFQPRVSLS